MDDVVGVGLVVKGPPQLAAVVAVDDAHAVGHGDAVLGGKATAGADQCHIVGAGQGDGDAGRQHLPCPGLQGHVPVKAGAQIHGGAAGGGETGRGDGVADLGRQGFYL